LGCTSYGSKDDDRQRVRNWLPEELVDLREADKEMKFLTDGHFGAFHFEKIALFNSEYAVKELMEMVESPAIGPCVRHIVLSALRLEPDGCFQWVKRLPVIERHSVETGTDIYDDLKTVFESLKEYKQPITIGITDEWSEENDKMLGFRKKLNSTDCGDFDTYNVTADEVDAFDTITDAAKEAGCQIQGLEVKLYPRRNCSKIELAWGYYDFPVTLARYLSRNKDINVHIETQIGKKSQKAINVVYDKQYRRLSIKHSRIPVVNDTWMLEDWMLEDRHQASPLRGHEDQSHRTRVTDQAPRRRYQQDRIPRLQLPLRSQLQGRSRVRLYHRHTHRMPDHQIKDHQRL